MARWFLILALTILSACQPPADEVIDGSADAALQLRPCTQEQFSHRGTRKDFQCGKLAVLENPQQADGRSIELNIVRLPALSTSPQPDPVFVLAGGPGQASTEIVSGVGPWLRLVNRERDFIFVDQRGTGKSNPLDCELDSDVDYTLTLAELEAEQERLLKQCLANFAADLPYYTTPYAADDINAVREALGYAQMNLWGGSYGTRLALEIMRRHPKQVRSAVLDGVAPIGINLPEYVLRDADEAMAAILQHCADNALCASRFPDLAQTLPALIQHYDANPETVTIQHSLRAEPYTLRLRGQMIAALLRLALYARDISPVLPLMIHSLQEGNFEPLMTLLSFSEGVANDVSIGLQQTILCAEDVARIQESDQVDNSLLQLAVIKPSKAICSFWPTGDLPEDYFNPVTSDIPTLLLSGGLDPVTPPLWGEFAAQHLRNHLHLVAPGAHHGVSTLGCVPEIIDEFVTDLLVNPLATDCINAIQPMPAFVSPAGPAMQTKQ